MLRQTLASLTTVTCLAVGIAGSPKAQELPDPVRMTLGGGPTASSLYAVVATLGTMIENNISGSAITTVEGGTVSNAVRVTQGQLQLAYSKPATIYAAQRGGERPFAEPSDKVLSVLGLTSGPVHIAAASELGYTSFAELVEDQPAVEMGGGAVGDSAEVFLRRILGYYDLTYDDIEGWGDEVRLVPLAEGLSAFKDGQINAQITPDILPHAGLLELSQARDIQLLSLEEDLITALGEQCGYARAVIPAGTYGGTAYEVPTLDDPYIIVAHADVPEDFVYWFTKSVMGAEGRELLAAIRPQLGEVTPEESFAMLGGTDLHPGAERYWREVGVLSD